MASGHGAVCDTISCGEVRGSDLRQLLQVTVNLSVFKDLALLLALAPQELLSL